MSRHGAIVHRVGETSYSGSRTRPPGEDGDGGRARRNGRPPYGSSRPPTSRARGWLSTAPSARTCCQRCGPPLVISPLRQRREEILPLATVWIEGRARQRGTPERRGLALPRDQPRGARPSGLVPPDAGATSPDVAGRRRPGGGRALPGCPDGRQGLGSCGGPPLPRHLLPQAAVRRPAHGARPSRARRLHELGFGPLDAVHLAFAEAAGADAFVPCDDRILVLGGRHGQELATRILNPADVLGRDP